MTEFINDIVVLIKTNFLCIDWKMSDLFGWYNEKHLKTKHFFQWKVVTDYTCNTFSSSMMILQRKKNESKCGLLNFNGYVIWIKMYVCMYHNDLLSLLMRAKFLSEFLPFSFDLKIIKRRFGLCIFRIMF